MLEILLTFFILKNAPANVDLASCSKAGDSFESEEKKEGGKKLSLGNVNTKNHWKKDSLFS